MTYGEKLRRLRQLAGLSQKALGLKCGYKLSSAERTVQFWEHDTQEPSIRVIRRLADALNVTIDELIPEENEEDDQL